MKASIKSKYFLNTVVPTEEFNAALKNNLNLPQKLSRFYIMKNYLKKK